MWLGGAVLTPVPSPYTSSVDTCRNRDTCCSLEASSKTCVPSILFSVNVNEFPKELSAAQAGT